jgi:DNA-binding protein YbaB
MTNTKPQVKIVNCETGEEIIRDANAEELAQMELDATNEAARKAEAEVKAQAKAALLTKLGITAEEAQLLLGGN